MSDAMTPKAPAEMTPEELQVYSADRLKTIAIQNVEIIALLKSIKGGVQFFVVLAIITIILQFV